MVSRHVPGPSQVTVKATSALWGLGVRVQLGRALGHFIFSLIGLKRILFTTIFQ